jgi:endogenous inhibitor of DNA gyrase (YacG/DUF329 family)
MKKVRTVNCPGCQTPVEWQESNRFRPFCSERCKLIDFGDWAAEKHSIPGEPVLPAEDDREQLQ